jgi:hypothetical protein
VAYEPVWTPGRQELCRRAEQHDFEPETPLNFTRRLARDHGWSLEEACAAVGASPLLLSRRGLAGAATYAGHTPAFVAESM